MSDINWSTPTRLISSRTLAIHLAPGGYAAILAK
jgi:hypothetical protein